MALSKPCRICREWFEPSPYAGERQKVCSTPACQRERKRRSMEAARKKKPTMDRERRLRKKLRAKEDWKPTDVEVQSELATEVARDAAIAKSMVVIEEHGRQIEISARDAAIVTMGLRGAIPRRLPPPGARDAASRSPPAS